MDATRLWTKMVALGAGALSVKGAPGPGTLLGHKRAHQGSGGPWLGIFHLEGLSVADREELTSWLRSHAAPLLAVRNLILAEPVSRTSDVAIELMTPHDLRPPGWEESKHPVLVFVTGDAHESGREARRAAYLDLRRRAPFLPEEPALWAERVFDAELAVQLARLSDPEKREAFKKTLDKSLHRAFDRQLPLFETHFLDDIAGVRDLWDPRSTLASLAASPRAPPALAAFAAEESALLARPGKIQRRYSFAQEPAGGFERPQEPATDAFRQALQAQGLELLEAEVDELFCAVSYLAQNGFGDSDD